MARAEPAAERRSLLLARDLPAAGAHLVDSETSYDKLARVDARNDSQVIFYDQLVPGSTLVGYLNADHWAVSVPISRSHPTITSCS